MADFLLLDQFVRSGDAVLVWGSRPANFWLLNERGLADYASGRDFWPTDGGPIWRYPAILLPTHGGHWAIVADIGNDRGYLKIASAAVAADDLRRIA